MNSGSIQTVLDKSMEIDGALVAALADWETGMCLGTAGTGPFDPEVAAAGNTQVVRSKMKVMKDLAIQGGIEDILISLNDQYHIIRPARAPGSTLFFYLALNRHKSNLALARLTLAQLEQKFSHATV